MFFGTGKQYPHFTPYEPADKDNCMIPLKGCANHPLIVKGGVGETRGFGEGGGGPSQRNGHLLLQDMMGEKTGVYLMRSIPLYTEEISYSHMT